MKIDIRKLSSEQKNTRRKIIEVSYPANFSHLGSCLSAVDLIDAIYQHKNKDDKFILSNGHAGIAWYVILEKYGLIKSSTIKKLNIHPDRNPKHDIHVSSGSLGQGLPIALGMALSDQKTNIYCMISDGECTEGSIWEALRVACDLRVRNLKIIINANGWGAYDSIHIPNLIKRIRSFGVYLNKVDGHNIQSIIQGLKIETIDKPLVIVAKTFVEQFPFLIGQDAHYYVMKPQDYNTALAMLSESK